MSTTEKKHPRHSSESKSKKPTSDEGEGQAGNFGSDSDQGKRKGVSPDRSSPNVSGQDKREKRG
ncbi:hypothetical protein [Chryseolinea lacunae]|uniref:Uncharacterized protein n=1 Tax=Chryseolinea lacunae TaxID=2801331 RepID=A0ABS1KZJ9_9BACT|nr:hypothetical protein [Chryseolinea lacunae]MBL0744598.1 hypothetical protein [Chryseolinea lacunae]